jgi:hypothetical protein
MPGVFAHVPWLLVAVQAAAGPGARERAAGSLGIALLIASQLLLGSPQAVWISGATAGLWALFVLVRARAGAVRWLDMAVAVGLGIACAGAQVVPTFDALRESERREPTDEFRNAYAMKPRDAVDLVSPSLQPGPRVETFMYPGAAFPVLAIAWALRRRRSTVDRAVVAAALAGAALGLDLSFGDVGLLHRAVGHLPLVGLFRCPSRYIFIFHVGAAIVVALGLTDLLRSPREPAPWRSLWPLAIPGGVGAAVGLALAAGTPPRWIDASPAGLLLGPAFLLGAGALVAFAERGHRAATVALVLLVAADLCTFSMPDFERLPVRSIDALVDVKVPPPAIGTRVRYVGYSWTNELTLAGVSLADGYASLVPERTALSTGFAGVGRAALVRSVNPSALRVMGVTFVLADAPRSHDHVPSPQPQWFRVPDPLPLARLVARAVPTSDVARDLDRIDVATTALVNEPVDLPADAAPVGTAALVEQRPGRIVARTSSPGRRLLVIAEAFHDGW